MRTILDDIHSNSKHHNRDKRCDLRVSAECVMHLLEMSGWMQGTLLEVCSKAIVET